MTANFKLLSSWVAMFVSVSVGLGLLAGGAAGQIQLRTDAPKPLSPAESQKRFRLPNDLQIELVAAEPVLADPVAVAFDEHGRMFVCELHGYNLEGYLDVIELNKTGKLDRQVRRIPARPEAQKAAKREQYGTVKLLIDSDGDGRMDRSVVWADRLPACYGLVPYRSGVIVTCAPDIVYLADRDGDGRPEIRETLFTGFGVGEMWTRISNPRWGLDNWIYVASGHGSGGVVHGPHLAEPVQLGNTDFRFKPDGTAIEPVTGGTGGFGLTMTDWGDRFLINNSRHVRYAIPLPYRYLVRNPFVPAPPPVADGADYNRVYPASQPHPWRLERSRQAAWVRFYGAREATAHGYFTASCGQLVYRAAALPARFRGNHFSCESQQNLIHRCLIEREGLRFKARRAPEEQQSEFLSSTDGWFRPVNLALGPDGGLYIVDMYREIIEDYSAIPRYLQQLYVDSLVAGTGRGRIWRVVAKGAGPPHWPNLAAASPAELVRELEDANAWHRLTAQRLLIERGDRGVADRVGRLLVHAGQPQARLHALYTLHGLGALRPEWVEQAIDDPHPALRVHALRLAERWLEQRPAMLAKVRERAEDADARVRLQAALTLGASRDRRALEALVRLAERDGQDPWFRAAILSAVPQRAGRLLAALAARGLPGHSRPLLTPLAAVVGARHQAAEIAELLRTVAGQRPAAVADASAVQIACLQGLLQGLKRGKADTAPESNMVEPVGQLLSSGSEPVRRLAFEVAAALKLASTPEMRAAFDQAARTAGDEGQPVAARRAALALLASAPYETLAATARPLLDPRHPLPVQLAAVDALRRADDPHVGSDLLAHWPAYSPQVQQQVLAALFERTDRLPALLDAIEQGQVPPQSLDALLRIQLLEHPEPTIRRRARQVLVSPAAALDQELLQRYRAALAGPRDPKRGRLVFKQQCAKCHRLGQEGYAVGPDLRALGPRPDQTYLLDLLQPSARITNGYHTYIVADTAGRLFTGVLAAETANSITLRKEEGAEQTILRRDIEAMKATNQSLMPEDLYKQIPPEDAAAVIAYLREALGPARPTAKVLFEDEPTFATLLKEGGGTAEVQTADKFSGRAALRVTPPQRFCAAIDGWQFRICQNPTGPNEFRYLRFAWKTRRGAGVMIELAANGHWPPADQPLRRYYSGKNTTAWQALQVSTKPPTDWTVVTRDLWRDFGDFTLTGIAPTALGAEALFDHIQLLRSLTDLEPQTASR